MKGIPQKESLSPSLIAVRDDNFPAYESKYVVDPSTASQLEKWAEDSLSLDPFSDPSVGNGYRVTSVYFDTPHFDMLNRHEGFQIHKYRIRRYGSDTSIHLERKSKRDGRISKIRTTIPLNDVETITSSQDENWPGYWFVRQLNDKHFQPTCRVTYERKAFIGSSQIGPIRLTLDRFATGIPTDNLSLEPLRDGIPLISEEIIVEFKYLVTMPLIFKTVIEEMKLTPSSFSKYRRCMAAIGQGLQGS